METVKYDLISLIRDGNWVRFAEFIGNLQKSSSGRPDISEILETLENEELKFLWGKINAKSSGLLLTFSLEEANEETFLLLHAIALFALKTVCIKFDSQELFDTISLLSGTVLSFPGQEGLKNMVSRVCELMWKDSVEGVSELMPSVFNYLINLSLLPNSKGAVINRIYSIRESLADIDLEEEEGRAIRHLLLSAAVDLNFLKNDKGRRIISFACCLDDKFVLDIHKALKFSILSATKPTLQWIAQVYFGAWKTAKEKEKESPELIQTIELECLQDLMYTALHSSREGNINSQFVKVFRVVSYFHKQKKWRDVGMMLYKLYSPILMRSLKVPNGVVRANAVFVLCDVFPLCDLDKGREFNERSLHEQLDVLKGLMEDPNVKVRQAVVTGVFSILTNYWEIVSSDRTRCFLLTFVQYLAWDASCDVRLCVARGFTVLIGNFLAYPVLKSILPKITNMFHDLNEKVRLAVIDLLFKVKGLRDIKFWDIVPMDHLLARLGEDSTPVVRKLVKLLTDTFAPPTASLSVQLERCVKLWSTNITSARRFYLHLANSLDVLHGCKFVVYVLEKLTNQMTRNNRSNSHSSMEIDGNKDDFDAFELHSQPPIGSQESGSTECFSLEDGSVVTWLCETVFFLLVGMKKTLSKPENEKINKVTSLQIAKLVPNIARTYQHDSIVNPLMMLASRYNVKLFPALSCSIISQLSSPPEFSPHHPTGGEPMEVEDGQEGGVKESSTNRIEVLLETACRWKKGSEVLNLIGEWIVFPLKSSTLRRSSTRTVKFKEPIKRKPSLGVSYLTYLLRHKSCRTIILSNHHHQLCNINTGLKHVLNIIRDRLASPPTPTSTQLSDSSLVGILKVYLITEILLYKTKNEDRVKESLGEVVQWGLSLYTASGEGSRSKRKRKRNLMNSNESSAFLDSSSMSNVKLLQSNKELMLFRDVMQVLSKLSHDFIILDLVTRESQRRIVELCTKILKSRDATHLLSNILNITSAILDEMSGHDNDGDDDGDDDDITLLKSILDAFVSISKMGDTRSKDTLTKIRSKFMTLVIKSYKFHCGRSSQNWRSLIHKFISSAVIIISHDLKKGNLIGFKSQSGDDDDTTSNDDILLPHQKPWLVDLVLDIVGHEKVNSRSSYLF